MSLPDEPSKKCKADRSMGVLQQSLVLIGLSHHTAPVSIRERLAFRKEDQPRALEILRERGCQEAVILSTCNRVEITVLGRDPAVDIAQIVRDFMCEFHSVPEKDFASSLYVHTGIDAARHLFEVAASLDSQILGESEILCQAKEAYRVASEAGSCGSVMRGLFERTFFLAKELRADGGIAKTQASVSSAAVQLAKKVFEIKNKKVLVVGTGEMATGIVRALKSAGVGEFMVASRTAARAQEFADQEGGIACEIAHLVDHLKIVDIVLVSSAAQHYIIGPDQIREAGGRSRSGRTLCLIDISVPRNVDPAVNEIEDTYLYDIDDLEEVARDGRREREAVAARWRPRLLEESREILNRLASKPTQNTARLLMQHASSLRQEVLSQVRGNLDPQALEELSRALERLQGRMLHAPMETLKQATREGNGHEATAWVQKLFHLDSEQEGSDDSAKPATSEQKDSSAKLPHCKR